MARQGCLPLTNPGTRQRNGSVPARANPRRLVLHPPIAYTSVGTRPRHASRVTRNTLSESDSGPLYRIPSSDLLSFVPACVVITHSKRDVDDLRVKRGGRLYATLHVTFAALIPRFSQTLTSRLFSSGRICNWHTLQLHSRALPSPPLKRRVLRLHYVPARG